MGRGGRALSWVQRWSAVRSFGRAGQHGGPVLEQLQPTIEGAAGDHIAAGRESTANLCPTFWATAWRDGLLPDDADVEMLGPTDVHLCRYVGTSPTCQSLVLASSFDMAARNDHVTGPVHELNAVDRTES